MDKNTTELNLHPAADDFFILARKIANRKARLLVGHFGFSVHDIPDIEQELLLTLFKQYRHYDPEKSRKTTFILRVVESKIADLIAYRQAECRDWRQRGPSLNAPAVHPDSEATDLIETIPTENNLDISLTLDISELMEKLPPDLAELCQLLMDYSVAEILESGLISRISFYRKLQTLKNIFRQTGQNRKFP